MSSKTYIKKLSKPRPATKTLEQVVDDYKLSNEVEALAFKRYFAYSLQDSMKETGLTKIQMAKKMGTSRSQLDRMLDPNNIGITLSSIVKAANVLNKNLSFKLDQKREAGEVVPFRMPGKKAAARGMRALQNKPAVRLKAAASIKRKKKPEKAAANQVYDIIMKTPKGTTIATLKKTTGLDKYKITRALVRLSKSGKIKRKANNKTYEPA